MSVPIIPGHVHLLSSVFLGKFGSLFVLSLKLSLDLIGACTRKKLKTDCKRRSRKLKVAGVPC